MLLLLSIAAYLLGAVPMAYLVARWTRGVDLRSYGSGNIGSSNVVAAVSKRWGLVVILFDLAKGMLAVYVTRMLGFGSAGQIIVGLAAITGHNWPVFLRFQGGRGIMTTLGVSFMLAPKLLLIFLAFVLFLGLLHHLALGTIIALVAMPTCIYFLPAAFGIGGESLSLSLGFTAMFILAVIRRLAVPRAPAAASLSMGDVLLNRFLFDRDIRDREAWIHRSSGDTSGEKGNRAP